MSKADIVVGASAPDFALADETGKTIHLSDFRGKRVVLYFYPKDAYPEIAERNAVVIGISPDAEGSHQKFKTKYDLPFILLVDADHQVAETYGVWEEHSMYGKQYTGITRSHFIIDEQGQLADVQFKISPQDSVMKALAALASDA
jgi:thioredoxin-dependent peroxiredoxin